MATVTIDVNPEVLEHAKERAALRNTTVERVLEESVASLAKEPGHQARIFAELRAWAERNPFTVDPGSYTREDLHERR